MVRLAVIVSLITVSLVLVGCSSDGTDKPQALITDGNAPSDANALYAEAVHLEEQAGLLIVVKDANLLKESLDKYNQLISKYPKSDKIDDAAFRSARIYEHFKDYDNAVKNYQRTYQWNPQTLTTARFKAAYLLDNQLGRRAEALSIYQDALSRITKSNEHSQWVFIAEQRVKELTGEAKPEP